MTKLTDTQLVVLSAACQRPDRNVLPLPAILGVQRRANPALILCPSDRQRSFSFKRVV